MNNFRCFVDTIRLPFRPDKIGIFNLPRSNIVKVNPVLERSKGIVFNN
jgi:hypothetical protein